MATADLPPPVIRSAAAADADAIAEVGIRSWEATYPGIVPDSALAEWIEANHQAWHDVFATRPADGPGRIWVAEGDGQVVGYATTTPAKDNWLPPPDGAGEITNLYLDPGVIGSGVGRRLYEHSAVDLAQRGFDPLVVWAFRDNHRAIGFYQRMGLVVDVPDHAWVLAGVPCPIVRFRGALAPSQAP